MEPGNEFEEEPVDIVEPKKDPARAICLAIGAIAGGYAGSYVAVLLWHFHGLSVLGMTLGCGAVGLVFGAWFWSVLLKYD